MARLPTGRRYPLLTADREGSWRGGFSFVQMADTQFGLSSTVKRNQYLRWLAKIFTCGLYIPPVLRDRTDSGYTLQAVDRKEIDFMRRAVRCINELDPAPAFVCVCGDLVNAYPNKGEQEAALQEEQVAAFCEVASEIDPSIPLVCMCGNHDVGDRPNARTIDLYKRRFGDDYFSFWVGGVKFIVINSQLYKNALDCEPLAIAQDVWLDAELEAEETKRARHVVVMSHIPPFIVEADEPSVYFNFEASKRADLLERMARAGVSLWLCGHFHENAGGVARVPVGERGEERELEVVVTGAVGANITRKPGLKLLDYISLGGMDSLLLDSESSGFRIVDVTEGGVRHEWHSIAELEARHGIELAPGEVPAKTSNPISEGGAGAKASNRAADAS